MTTYIIKRIFLMLPTLLIITLVIFAVLNFAPGRPGGSQVGGEGTETATSQEARESYRIFKEQFNFDKPIFFNTYYSLTNNDVLKELTYVADFNRPICEGEKQAANCITIDAKPGVDVVIEATDVVEDWGAYIVPQLLEIAETSDRDDVRRLAINQLAVNAQLRLRNQYGKDVSQEDAAFNQKAAAENENVSKWTTTSDMKGAPLDKIVAENWKPWFEANKTRFEYSGSEKMGILFTDTRFAKYFGNLIRLDFGVSIVDKRPVLDKILEKLPFTLTINFLAIFLAYIISVPLGVWSAYRQNTTADRIVTLILFLLYSLPSFFVAVVMLIYLTQGDPIRLFPTGDFAGKFPGWYTPGVKIDTTDDMTTLEYILSMCYHLVLPVFCLTYGAFASISRYARTGLLDVIRSDYIRTARAKGLDETTVIVKHAVRNGMIPVLTLIGLLLPALIGGSIVVEFVFNIPGMGQFILDSILALDYNSIMGVLLFSAVLTLIGLLISDISYAIVDPRISFD